MGGFPLFNDSDRPHCTQVLTKRLPVFTLIDRGIEVTIVSTKGQNAIFTIKSRAEYQIE